MIDDAGSEASSLSSYKETSPESESFPPPQSSGRPGSIAAFLHRRNAFRRRMPGATNAIVHREPSPPVTIDESTHLTSCDLDEVKLAVGFFSNLGANPDQLRPSLELPRLAREVCR